MTEGYCTVEDVRRTLQDAELTGALAEDDERAVVQAITAQSEWLRATTGRHWYEPDGIEEDTHDLVPTELKSRDGEEHDIPSTPHPQHSTMFNERRGRYPLKMVGPYTKVRLDKHYAEEITALDVRDVSGSFEDWMEASDKTEDEDWELYVEPGSSSSPSYAYLNVHSLPPLQHYSGAVRVSYTYGDEGIPGTVRDAVSLRAAAKLVIDDEEVTAIPDSGQLISVQTKAQQWRDAADDLLEVYR